MKLSTILASAVLIALGLFASAYALTGVPVLLVLCGGNVTALRVLLSFGGVAAGWLLFWLIAFRPLKFVS